MVADREDFTYLSHSSPKLGGADKRHLPLWVQQSEFDLRVITYSMMG
jgi:hypothetical protein